MDKTTHSLLAMSALAFSAASVGTFAQTPSGYVNNLGGIVRAQNYGTCLRTGYWAPSMAIAECDPDLVPKPAPKPAPAPAPAAKPAPKPAPAKPAPAAPAKPAAKPAAAPVIEKVTLQADALFDFDKAVVKPDARTKLDGLVTRMKGVNLEVVIAVGHTDRIGSDAYNQKLSVRRAEAVKAYLVSKGIAANRVYTEGKGKRQPVKNCTGGMSKATVACLEPNRRVEVEVVGTRSK
ncbi:MAG: OmpA family protein [Betaproteobacteria bacterium]|nr:OmpA family protein [Betaproteobacteria bacterium]